MKYIRGVVVGCTHAQLMIPQAWDALERVFDKWKPRALIHLGDYLETSALRSGAEGTSDEGKDLGLDLEAGFKFLRWYFKRPAKRRILALGNHDDTRWDKWMDHPNATKRHLAELLHERAHSEYHALQIHDVLPYDIKKGWLHYAGANWGHGYMYNENAVRDHAEMVGGITYMAHLHSIQERNGRTVKPSVCRCIGWLGDAEKAGYARLRRNTLSWDNGFLLTEHSEKDTVSWQIRLDETGKFRLPF